MQSRERRRDLPLFCTFEPTFAGLVSATAGSSCGEVDLAVAEQTLQQSQCGYVHLRRCLAGGDQGELCRPDSGMLCGTAY